MGALKNTIAVFFTIFIFSNFIVFGFLKGILPIAPIYSLIGILVITLPIALSYENFEPFIDNKLTAWLFFYILIAIAYGIYGYFSGIDLIYLQEKVTELLKISITILITLFVINSKEQLRLVVKTITIFICVGVLFIFLDVFNPLMFSDLIGRGSGMYLNANYAATMLLMGLIFIKDRITDKIFFLLLVIAGAGIVATFSRFGIFFFLIYLVYIFRNSFKSIMLLIFLFSFLTTLFLKYVESILPSFVNIDELIFDRFSFLGFGNETASEDFSADQRSELFGLAIEDFLKSPFLGGGLGRHLSQALSEYDFQLAHNTYIGLLVDYGFLGISFIPLLLYSIYSNRPGNRDSRFFIFVVLILINGFFSHNLLDHYGFVFFYALFAAEFYFEAKEELFKDVVVVK